MGMSALAKAGKVPPSFHGKKGVSGRKKTPRDIYRYLTEQIDGNWAQLVEALVQKAVAGDKELLQYCFDRRLGKPKASLEIEGVEEIGAGVMVKLIQAFNEARKVKLLEGGNDVQGQGETKELQSGKDAEG